MILEDSVIEEIVNEVIPPDEVVESLPESDFIEMDIHDENNNFYMTGEGTASEVTSHHMKKYAKFTIVDLFGHVVDALNCVYRRTLIAFSKEENKVYKIGLWGGQVQRYHPHSDTSIHDSIAKLMQNFRYQIPLIQHHGNAGSYSSPKGAAPRYLEASATEFLMDVYFDTIDEALVAKYSEIANDMEIQFLIPKIPMTIYIHHLGIATGFSTFTLPRDFTNVCDFTIWYIDQVIDKKHEYLINNCFPRKVCEYLLPMFPIDCTVLNKEELLNAYEKGDFDHKVKMEGSMYMGKNFITIKTIPFGIGFKTKAEPFIEGLKNRDKTLSDVIDALDEYHDHADDEMAKDFKLIFKKKSSAWKMLPRIRQLFTLQTSLTPNSRFVTKRLENHKYGPGQLVDIWFRERERALTLKYSKQQESTFHKIHILEGLVIIKDHVDEVVQIIKDAEMSESWLPILMERFNLTMYQASRIGKMQLDELNKSSRANLPFEIQKNRDLLKQINYNMTHIPQIIKGEVTTLRDKYKNQAKKATTYPEYIGFIKTEENGYILIQNLKEILKYNDFNHIEIKILPPSCFKYRYKAKSPGGNYIVDYPVLFPKHMQLADPLMFSQERATCTVVLNKSEEGRTIFRVNYLSSDNKEGQICAFCKDKVLTINSDGSVKQESVKNLPLRKSINSLGNKTNTVFISNMIFSQLIIFYTNPNEPNTVRVDVVNKNNNKISLLVGDEQQTSFNIFPFTHDMIVFQPHESVFNRIKSGHIKIDDPVKFMEGKLSTIMNLSTGKCSHNTKQKFKLYQYSQE